MKKLTLLFAAAAVLFAGCVRVTNIFEQVDGRLDKLENQKIPDIEEQIDAINASLENLSTMDKELKGYIEELTATAEGLKEQIKATNTKLDEVKSALQGEISSAKEAVLEQLESVKSELVDELSKIDSAIALLQSKDSELEHKIAELRSYVNDELGKTTDWVSATFATLDQYNALVNEVADVKSLIASVNDSISLLESKLTNKINDDISAAVSSLSKTIQQKVNELTNAYIEAVAAAKSEITAAYTSAIQSAIANLDDSLRAWVGEQLAGYYTIAEVDSKIEALLLQLGVDDASLMEELNGLKEQLKSTAADITAAYKKAIEEAIASNGGVIDSSSLEPINNRIDNEVATINGKLAELQAQVDKNTADIAKLLARIQSVSYVPRYSDGKATVKFESDASEVVFDFEVSPKDAVAELATVWQSAVSVKAVYTQTRAVSFIDMPILKFETDAENGVISVFASGENLSQDFKNGKLEASARLAISDGNNSLTSDYVPMVAKVMPPYVLETKYSIANDGGGATIGLNVAQASNPAICVDYGDGYIGVSNSHTYYKKGEYTVRTYFNKPIEEIVERAYLYSHIRSIVIPATVTKLGYQSFNSSLLETISFEKGSQLKTIEGHAFGICYNLQGVHLPSSVEYIGEAVFVRCTSLKYLSVHSGKYSSGYVGLEEGVAIYERGEIDKIIAYTAGHPTEKLSGLYLTVDIGWGTFVSCQYIKKIDMVNIGTIEQVNFVDCDNLEEIRLVETTYIANNVLNGCDKLANINAPDASFIGENTFCDNESLSKITLGCDELTTLSKVGNNNPTLSTLWIPSGVTEIANSFNSDPSLVNVYCKATTPPALTSSFDAIPAEAKIYVPWTSVSAYKAAEGWHDHEDKIVGYNFETNEVVDVQPNNQIWYTTTDGNIVEPYSTDNFGANIVSNTYENGKGVITFDEELQSIGNGAFTYCRNLESVVMPNAVSRIGVNAFAGCTSLTDIIIPNSVKSIEDYSFSDCLSLANVVIGNGVTTIGDRAFYYCTKLTNVIIPNSVYRICEQAFSCCTSLESITIPDSVTSVDGLFEGCASLKEIISPNSTIDKRCLVVSGVLRAFAPAGLTEYTIPDGIEEIGYESFLCCSSLTSITISNSVTSIGDSAFSGCSGLINITIPDSVTSIGYNAFCNCTSLASITIPDSVTKIKSGTFYGCSNLASVTIGKNVSSLVGSVFGDCYNLMNIYCKSTTPPTLFYNNTNRYGSFPFNNGMKIYVPYESYNDYMQYSNYVDSNDVQQNWYVYEPYIVAYDFEKGEVVEATTPANNQIWYTTTDGNSVSISSLGLYGEYSSSVLDIVSHEYVGGKGVITTTSDIYRVSQFCFSGFNTIETMTLPNSLKIIENSAFANCTSLKLVNIPDGVTTIGSEVFDYCFELETITIPDSVTSIGEGVFAGCVALREINSKYATEDKRCLIFDNTLIGLASAGITEYTIPDGVTKIGYEACKRLTQLKKIVIPDSVTFISQDAFYRCSSLESITIPANVVDIEWGALQECESLAVVYCKSLTPPTLHENLTFAASHPGLKIYVPAASVAAYKSANYWSEFAGRIIAYDFSNEMVAEPVVPANNEIWYTSTDGNIVRPYSTSGFGVNVVSNTYEDGKGVMKFDGDVTSLDARIFYDVSTLSSIVIPDSVQSIGAQAFAYTGITSVIIGAGVKSISEYAFYNCFNLEAVFCRATTPPTAGSVDVFYNNKYGRKFYVPTSCVEAYKKDSYWRYFADYIVGYDF